MDDDSIERVREFIAEYRLVVIFFGIELFFVLGGLLISMVEIRIDQDGAPISHVMGGLLGGLAVVWLLVGAVTYGTVQLSNLYMRYRRDV